MSLVKRARRLVRRGLEVTGLIGPYYRWLERRMAAEAPGVAVDDGRPMPPSALIMAVNSTADQGWFSERGRADAATFMGLAAKHGLTGALQVLDFGCGSGRIARWTALEVTAAGGGFFGTDLNPKLVGWCAANLPGRYTTNRLQPPLDIALRSLDLVYAHSVFTHLTEATARAWMEELAKRLRAGGLAVLTFHDEAYAGAWGPREVAHRLGAEGYVVWNNALEGSNYLSAWTTHDRFRAMADAGFEVLEIVPGHTDHPEQAIAVLRAR